MRSVPLWIAASALAVAACSDSSAPIASPAAPLLSHNNSIPGQYIVVLRKHVPNAAAAAQGMTAAHGGNVGFTYESALKGFSANLPPQAVQALLNNPNVEFIEEDQIASATSTEQSGATWGLDRIDQRSGPIDGVYHYDATGSGVTAYIIDTGILFGHSEFGGRARTGYDAVTSGGTAADCNGHGTHVAGTVGGATYGVAKGVALVAVRVLNCSGSGSYAGVIAGVDWVTSHRIIPAVANMSLIGPVSSSLDLAVQNSIAAGVTYGLAAGNGNAFNVAQDACNYSPARVPQALTVGATSGNDAKASFSNFGNCVDLFAPGVSITSAWYTSATATNTISGTSMATPHVVGVAALFLQGNPGASPAAVSSAILAATTKNVVTSANTPNNDDLLYSLFVGGGDPPTPNSAPTASFSFSCAGLTCTFTDGSSDGDGFIQSRSWNFGDGSTSTATNPTRTYASSGTRTVTLTVTDDDFATGSTSQNVTVTAPPVAFTLSASASGNGNHRSVKLQWSGATSATVDIFRNNSRIATVSNSGSYTESVNRSGSNTYRVCNAGTATCSNNATVSW